MDLGRLLLGYKNNASPEGRFRLRVANAEGLRIGSLTCLDRGLSSDARVVAALTEWRRRHMHYFLTQFVATSERTLAWLERIVLPAPDRILLDRYLALSYVDFGPLSAWQRGEAVVPEACRLR